MVGNVTCVTRPPFNPFVPVVLLRPPALVTLAHDAVIVCGIGAIVCIRK